jgi:hypothetical protein
MSNVTDYLHHDDNSLQSLRACCMLISQNVRREHAQSMHCNVSDVVPSIDHELTSKLDPAYMLQVVVANIATWTCL